MEDAGKQTRSDPMETVRPGKSRSDSPEISSRETWKIYSKVASEKVENALFCKPLMRPNKRAAHVIYAVLEPSPPPQY